MHLDGVGSVWEWHLVHYPQRHVETVSLELGKLPGTTVVTAGAAHPDPATIVQDVLVQVGGVGVMAGVLWRGGEGRGGEERRGEGQANH